MDELHRKVLRKERQYLIDNLILDSVIDRLYSNELLTFSMKDEINCQNINAQKIALFLDTLPKRGPNAFPKFLSSLTSTSQNFIKNRLIISLREEIGKGNINDTNRSTCSPFYYAVFQQKLSYLSKNLELKYVVNGLISAEILSVDDSKAILSHSDGQRQIETFLHCLKSQGLNRDKFHLILEVLDKNGWAYISDELRRCCNTLTDKMQSQDMSQLSLHSSKLSIGRSVDDSVPVFTQKPQTDCSLSTNSSLTDPNRSYTNNNIHSNETSTVIKNYRIEKLNKQVSEKFLSEIAANVGTILIPLGLQLGYKKGRIEQFMMSSPYSVQTQVTNLLIDWKNRLGNGATVALLVKALKNCNADLSDFDSTIENFCY